MPVEYGHVKENPMADEYERVLFILVGLIVYVPIKYVISYVVDSVYQENNVLGSSSFIFIVSLALLFYAVKIGLQIFWISSYNIKYCLIAAVGINSLFFFLYLSTKGLGTYDKSL